MSESKELVLVQLPAPADLESAFISDEYISNLIADIRQKALSVVGDVNTVKGRGVYISMASTVRRTKTAIDDAGKNLVAEMKKRPALVDASRKKVRDALDELAVEIRRPATEWEAEQERIKAEEAARVKAENDRKQFESDHEIALLMNDAFDREAKEKAEEAERQRIAHEEELKRQAEEKARREAEEKIERERAESARREAELKFKAEQAERERIAAEQKAEAEKKEATDRAEREKQEAIAAEQRKAQEEAERIKREAEAKEAARLAEEKRIADEAASRAADVEHRRAINAAAVQALIDQGIPEDWAKACVVAIARGKVPATTINY
ncbi:hypothetical protein ACKKKJ_002104 [Salmonella enterica subsp. enterica serovar Minnesota]|nr:hypothetical protein [Salmonella enterica]ECU3941118.1 hypothetical protein [Salmonella enterica subsp. enterica serovar Muenchen]ELZ4877168.1 hypothetical protein [Salmonella enterica]ELZ4895145.1 hypothetical protein [Salmonella enterica]